MFDAYRSADLVVSAPGGPYSVLSIGSLSLDGSGSQPSDGQTIPDPSVYEWDLNPADNGLSDSREGQYGDFDSDGLNNLEEYQLGTHPGIRDTDG